MCSSQKVTSGKKNSLKDDNFHERFRFLESNMKFFEETKGSLQRMARDLIEFKRK
jgi:hypothetical protein